MTKPSTGETFESLQQKMKALKKEVNELQWAYSLTEGILSGKPGFSGVNERWGDGSPILAAKLAKELMGKSRRPTWITPAVEPPPKRDYYLELVEWLGSGFYRAVKKGPDHLWHIRDEARSAELSGENLNLILHSQNWDIFRSRK